MNMTPYKCYYCGRFLRKDKYWEINNRHYHCGSDNKGVRHEYSDDGATLQCVGVYEKEGRYNYVSRHYLNEFAPSCEITIYSYNDKWDECEISLYLQINELLVDKITPNNLIDKMKLYLLLI